MKWIVFNGSPAEENSHTNVIIQALLRGAEKAGAETENIFLTQKNINHCKGCFVCWFKTPGKCVMQDDMNDLLHKYANADIVCFATPVYTWNMTAALKNFVDRLAPLKAPKIVQSDDRFDLANTESKQQQFIVISNCGFPGDLNFETMKAVFASCNPILEIYRYCGKLLKSKDTSVKKIVEQYLCSVEQAGFEIENNQNVSEKTKMGLEMRLMSVQNYVRYLGM